MTLSEANDIKVYLNRIDECDKRIPEIRKLHKEGKIDELAELCLNFNNCLKQSTIQKITNIKIQTP